jgi:hypothetical protein
MSEIPDGWYDDGSGALRYWDGAAWTEHTASVPANPAPASGRRTGVPTWVWVTSAAAVVGLMALTALVVLLLVPRIEPVEEAKRAIDTYDSAWLNIDCDALEEATTVAWRSSWGYDDCDTFTADARQFDEVNRDYQIDVTSTTHSGDTVTVLTTESYTNSDGVPVVDYATYTVIKVGDAWRIDGIDFASDDAPDGGATDDA